MPITTNEVIEYVLELVKKQEHYNNNEQKQTTELLIEKQKIEEENNKVKIQQDKFDKINLDYKMNTVSTSFYAAILYVTEHDKYKTAVHDDKIRMIENYAITLAKLIKLKNIKTKKVKVKDIKQEILAYNLNNDIIRFFGIYINKNICIYNEGDTVNIYEDKIDETKQSIVIYKHKDTYYLLSLNNKFIFDYNDIKHFNFKSVFE